MKLCEAPPCDCVCHKLGYISHCDRCKPVVSEPKAEHLEAPVTLENKRANVYCPVEKELTYIGFGKSTDGMEVYICMACNEPEPELQTVTQEELYTIAEQLDNDE